MKTRILVFCLLLTACQSGQETPTEQKTQVQQNMTKIELTLEEANRLAGLPMSCIQNPLPYKSGVVIASEADLQMPQVHHPAFYGCFDWHSAVHGHWVLVNLLKHFPDLDNKEKIRQMLHENLLKENILTEVEYFSMNKWTKSFERTYGWAWLLKLTEELHTWDDKDAKAWEANLQPLTDIIIEKYIEYYPKLVYPIRVGEHSNTAFGMTFAWDYANTTGHTELKNAIEQRAKAYYTKDKGCPISWEPSGYDFLSPCLEEADIMRRVLSKDEFKQWFEQFLPDLVNSETAALEPAVVSDRSDGKLVHLDGLNFSRAWCLYGITKEHPEWAHLNKIADEHMAFSLPNIVDGDYMGEHWLGSFALFALNAK